METFIWMIFFIFLLACVFYFIIKAAVRDGMLAYDQIKRQEEQAQNQTQTNKKEDG